MFEQFYEQDIYVSTNNSLNYVLYAYQLRGFWEFRRHGDFLSFFFLVLKLQIKNYCKYNVRKLYH